MRKRFAVLVLGIARSGTSALAGALSAAGVDFGSDLKPKDWQNPRGNFEDFGLSRLNQDILASQGRTWSSLRPMPTGWRSDPRVCSLEAQIKETIRERCESSPLVGLKDPRLVPLYELYEDAFSAAGCEIRVVAISRAPREVIRSIRLSGYYHGRFPRLAGPLLVRRYKREISAITARAPSMRLEYSDLVSYPAETLEAIIEGLPFSEAGVDANLEGAVRSIDETLYRNRI